MSSIAICQLTKILFIVKNSDDATSSSGTIGNKFQAKCCLCTNKRTIIKGSLGVTSNFVTHLKRKHLPEYETYVKKRKLQATKKNVLTKQELFQKDILDFVVQTTTPLSIVDNSYFRKLFEHRINLKIPSRRIISGDLNSRFDALKSNIKNSIAKNTYFCTTADIWSNKHRSFFGYTCHWLDKDYTRISAALVCKRFSGAHTFDRIAEVIQEINEEFNLNPFNIVATVTDNGSNFVKAFKEYGVKDFKLEESHQSAEYDADLTASGENYEDEFENIEFFDFENLPTQVDLPKHYRCGSHTINLIATTDFNTAVKSEPDTHKTHLQVCIHSKMFYSTIYLKLHLKK